MLDAKQTKINTSKHNYATNTLDKHQTNSLSPLSRNTPTRVRKPHQYITSGDKDDALHIKTDIVIEDESEYHIRKEKYFGEKSMLRVIHKEEN